MHSIAEPDGMSPMPAVHCSACEFRWNSLAMAEGLRLLGSCPKCGGALSFADDAAAAAPPEAELAPTAERFTAPARETAPHLVLGIPRRSRGQRTGSSPGPADTGMSGYFGYRASTLERSHSENDDPRVFETTRWWRHVSHSPALTSTLLEASSCPPMRATLHSLK